MRTPPFVQVWSNNKRKRFYVFKDERIYFNDGGFYSSSVNEEHQHSMVFKIQDVGLSIEVDDENEFILLAGAKRKKIPVNTPIFLNFKNYDFFVDNVGDKDDKFHFTGLNLGEEFSDALMYSRSDNVIFIVGDTGTGKEILAKNMHYNSSRRHEPFVVFNCSSFDDGLAETELFGNIKGAFTSAMHVSKGAFMSAGRGTLVLDEIACLPLDVQPMLLRAIELNEVKAVGSDTTSEHKARLIVTSSVAPRDLLKMGRIREDLFYRIEGCTVYLSELRKKRDKILELAEFFLGDVYKLSDDVKKLLLKYDWPGNIRELKSVMERAILLSNLQGAHGLRGGKTMIELKHIRLSNHNDLSSCNIQDPSAILSFKDSEKENIRKALVRHSWDLGQASKALDICKSTLLCKIKEYDLVKY